MQAMTPHRILVTGGAGYIGAHTAKYLSRSGLEPVVLDNLSVGHESAVRWGPLVKCDLADRDRLGTILREYRIDAVIHFAAHCYVGESVTHPDRYFQNNVVNTLSLLDSMRQHGVGKIVFSSSCATYGVPSETPISEQTPQRPINPYGESKLFVERILQWYGKAYGLQWVALRYFNAAGADPEGDLGEKHNPETHLIPLAIQAVCGQGPELQVFGLDYSTPDGSAVRDYIHVWDLAAAHVRALEYLQAGGESCALNLGSGTGYSVLQLVRMVEAVSGRAVPVRYAPRRDGDPPVLIADPRRASQTLGWNPGCSSIENIVQTAFRWHSRSPQSLVF